MNILLLEDDELDARLVGKALSGRDDAPACSVVHVRSLAVALARLGRDEFDAVVVDLNLPDAHGSDTVDKILQLKPQTPIVILSGNDDEQFALDLIRKGAQDFLVKGKDGLGSLGRTLRFCVERKETERRLQHLASYDALTGLANRQEVYTQLRRACAHAERQGDMVALLLIDLDRFKYANDIHGHQVGDTILKTVGNRLQALTREGDTAGRLGGDEFAVILEGLAYAHSAHRWAERALKKINEPIEVDELVFPLKASIGGAIFPSHGDDVDAIMRCADQAMYSVKKAGRNNVAFFQPNMGHRDSRRNELSVELPSALELGALTAAFQPKVSLQTGQVVGFEALDRWIRAADDIVTPAEFLPLARQQRLMPALGRRMRFLALEASARWRSQTGQVIPISVNVDAQELQSASFAADLARDLAEHSVDPQNLRLEVSERAFIEDESASARNLLELAGLGVGIELDDFGAGHTSLTYLGRFPINTLKLDRKLIDKLGVDEQQAVIAQSLIDMGKNLGIEVIAEGIETRIQLRMLMRMGCPVGQGFLLGRPMMLDQACKWLTNQGARIEQKLESMTGLFEALPSTPEHNHAEQSAAAKRR